MDRRRKEGRTNMRGRRRSIGVVLTVAGIGFSMAVRLAPAAVAGPEAPSNRIWATRYLRGEFGEDVAVSHDGARVFVTGTAAGLPVENFGTVAYDAETGAQIWAATYDGPEGNDQAVALAVSPDDHVVYVTGNSLEADANSFATVAYDAATGLQLWVARYSSTGDLGAIPSDLVVSPDGTKLFVTGQTLGTEFDFATVAYDAGTGTQMWTANYDGPGHGRDEATAIGVAPDGSSVFVAGDSPGTDSVYDDVATIAYDPTNGSVRWVARFDGGHLYAEANDLAVAPDGRLFVTGLSIGAYATEAYDQTSGALLWIRAFHGPRAGVDTARSVGVSPNGSLVFVTGTSNGFTGPDFGTIAYSATTGATIWMNVYNGSGDRSDNAEELAVAPDGSRVFVTGSTAGATYDDTDYATVTISATTGQRLRVDLYDGSGSFDHPYGIAVAPDSSAFYVTGTTTHRLGSAYIYDYGTVAYRT
jgi:hypothetical protein